ncbi:MAG TPA: biotin carboxylase N-terminal domain-containing protein [Bacillota bacterium]|nr:biotin carboxylase N-terminal domain-containing protein [Bacillota bacterium]
MVFKRVLIANRGEIAVRIIRTLRRLDIRSVAVFTDVDAGSLHVLLADEAVAIGPPLAYLDPMALIEAARRTGSEAIHPGYGFLSENADFAQACREHDLAFIGPRPATIRAVGDKLAAKEMLAAAGLPVLPFAAAQGARDAVQVAAAELGYPALLKAAGGGGGKGIQFVGDEAELGRCLEMTREKAGRLFKDERLYLERYLPDCRHVEVQVLADDQGHAIHLGTRNCSVQRRHQKLIEEAPSPGLESATAEAVTRAALRAAATAGYTSAGTVEFLVSPGGEFFIIELNTRLQVEHTVTEEITGVDLVAEQLRVAAGEPLGYLQDDIALNGWAMECRICAEDPLTFCPSPGPVGRVHLPAGPGVRVDSHLYSGCRVPHHYDSLLAKVIVRGRDRRDAIERLRQAMREVAIEGVNTNLALHRLILDSPAFRDAAHNTTFLADLLGRIDRRDLPACLSLPAE